MNEEAIKFFRTHFDQMVKNCVEALANSNIKPYNQLSKEILLPRIEASMTTFAAYLESNDVTGWKEFWVVTTTRLIQQGQAISSMTQANQLVAETINQFLQTQVASHPQVVKWLEQRLNRLNTLSSLTITATAIQVAREKK